MIVDIGSLNQGFYLYNGNSTHLSLHWSNSAGRNYLSGNSGGNHELMVDDFTQVTMNTPLIVTGTNDFKVGNGNVTIKPEGDANFAGILTAYKLESQDRIQAGSGSFYGGSRLMFLGGNGSDMSYFAGGNAYSDHIFKTMQGGSTSEILRIGANGDIGILGQNYGTSGQVLTSGGAAAPVSWTTVSGGVGNDGSINTTGIITAASFSGVGNDIVTSRWTLGANGSNHYTFTGPGGLSNTDDPVIYLARGQTYEFENNSGGSHPFQIQDSENNPYTTGVTYPNGGSSAASGITTFAVPFSASNSLQYKCTSHGTMGNTIVIYPNLNV